MTLVVREFLTLDGVMQGSGGAEVRSGGFDRGGWLIGFAGADMGEIVDGWFEATEAVPWVAVRRGRLGQEPPCSGAPQRG